MSSNKSSIIIATLLITLGFVARLLPHPANFAPISAIALFGGLYLPKRWAIILPIAAMFASDILIGFYEWKIMLAVYGSFVLSGCIGLLVKKNKKFHTVFGGAVLGSVVFFLATNLAVWTFGTMYPSNFNGLIQCYIMAIPFFKNTLAGDIFYTAILVGGFELLSILIKKTWPLTVNRLC